VCLQLQQCVRYAEYFEKHVGDHGLDMFYYENPDGLAPEPYQFDLSKMIMGQGGADSKHLHDTTLDWLAYYHYRYNDSCARLLKFEHDILFAEPVGFDYMSMFQKDIARHANDTLLVYRRACEADEINTFNVVLNKTTFLEFLDLYMLHTVLSGDSGLNSFLAAYETAAGEKHGFTKPRLERMYMGCIEDSTANRRQSTEHWSFVHCDEALRDEHPLCLEHYSEADNLT
jgi:hypothetical protein